MTNLEIKNQKATTTERASMKWFALRPKFEGRVTLLKTGQVSFIASQHNIDIWKSAFPECVVTDLDAEAKLFEEFVVRERPTFKLKRQPLWWQEKATEKQYKIIKSPEMANAFAFFYDPGAGKSKSLTDFATMLYCMGIIDALIVLPPNVLVGEQWTNEDSGALVKDIHEDVAFKSWLWNRNLPKAHKQAFEDLLTFDGFQCVVANIDAAKTERGFEYLDRFIKRHKGRVLFAVDEAHLLGNPSSARHKKCIELGRKCKWRSVLTGTPITKDLMSAYAIFKFLDEKILGFRYASAFRNSFCVTKWNGFADQIVGHKNIDRFYELIEPYTARVSQSEMGLEKLYDDFVFDLSDEQTAHFQRFKKEWLTALDNGEYATASIAMTAAMKLQQISNGFVVGEDGTVQYLDNARLRALDAWLETIDEGEKVMVWCRFIEDAKLLTKHFGHKAVDLSGNVDTKQRIENKNRFLNDPAITRCVATPDAAGTGMDLIQSVCNRAVYYSTSEHYVNRIQSEDRVLRVGGQSVAFITDLIARKSGDKRIIANLRGKRELSKMTLDDVRMIFEE